MDNELIQYIDATDNMQLEYLESKIVPDFIKLCNPEWNENVDESEAFINALRLADEFWNIYIKHAIAEVEAIEIILKSSDKCKECYLVFDVEMPYRKAIKYINNDKIKYMIFKSSREGYDIRAFRDYCKFKDEIYFVDNYARTNEGEDRARLFESICSCKNYEEYPNLNNKMNYLKKVLTTNFPEISYIKAFE